MYVRKVQVLQNSAATAWKSTWVNISRLIKKPPLVWPNFVPIRVSYSKCADDAKILYNKLWNIYARRSSCSRGLLTKTTKAVTHFSKGAEKYQEVEYIKAIPNT